MTTSVQTVRDGHDGPALEHQEVDWRHLIDDVLLASMVCYGTGRPSVETVYLTGSYARGTWNPHRPNVNVYVIASPGAAATVRAELARLLLGVRRELRDEGVDFVVDCHPYTVSQRDPAWVDRPVLTLTTKVLASEAAIHRYDISPTIGVGWAKAHRVLVGDSDALSVFAEPPRRDRAWLRGAHQALSHYRNVLDHLPWALDWESAPRQLVEESCRYAEEALRDGVSIGLTDDEVLAGRNIYVLHDWTALGRAFYLERFGPAGPKACDTVDRLKSAVVAEHCDLATAEQAWFDALQVWSVVWDGYCQLVRRMGSDPDFLRVTAWL